jgi:hypothetical protein
MTGQAWWDKCPSSGKRVYYKEASREPRRQFRRYTGGATADAALQVPGVRLVASLEGREPKLGQGASRPEEGALPQEYEGAAGVSPITAVGPRVLRVVTGVR